MICGLLQRVLLCSVNLHALRQKEATLVPSLCHQWFSVRGMTMVELGLARIFHSATEIYKAYLKTVT
jgi:hypothetical protein